MAIAKMKLVQVSGKASALDRFIKTCCLEGTFQPEPAAEYISSSLGFRPMSRENPYTAPLQTLEELSSEYDLPLQLVDSLHEEAVHNSAEYLRQLGDQLHDWYEEKNTLTAKLEENHAAISSFQHFAGMDINLNEIFSCVYIKVRFGYLPKESYEKLELYKKNPYVLFFRGTSDAGGYWGAYFAPKNEVMMVDRIFAKLRFERAHVPNFDGTADEAIITLKEESAKIRKRLAELDAEARAYGEHEETHLNELYTYLTYSNAAFGLQSYAVFKKENFYYFGWIQADDETAFILSAKGVKGITLEIQDPGEEMLERVPTKLRNGRLFRPFSYFVSMFGLPKYGESDPTVFFGITYAIMFGLMFADLGQGAVLILAGIVMWKVKKMELGPILIRCGAMSCIFGTLFGSVFGLEHLLDPMFRAMGFSEKPIDVMESMTTVLIFAIGIGIAMLYFSMLINLINLVRHKRFAQAVFSRNGVAGMLFYTAAVIAVVQFMSSMMGSTSISLLPGPVLAVMIVIALCMMFFEEYVTERTTQSNWKPESFGGYALQNGFELFESMLSFFSNTLSFLRIGAFILIHACMMMVVVSLASMSSNPIVVVIIYVIGNVLVIVLEALLTAIQALRLQYYEMFSRYYTGEGTAFQAAKVEHTSS